MSVQSWPTNKEAHAHMKMRQEQNAARASINPNENWMRDILKSTGLKWGRQSQWGFRLYDFWCHPKGIAIEVDGYSHNEEYDNTRDDRDYTRSGIKVIRVRNLNEQDAELALRLIAQECSWNERRAKLGLKPIKGAGVA